MTTMRRAWLAFAITAGVQAITGWPLRTGVAPAGVVELEFARSGQRAAEVIASWPDVWPVVNILADFGFIAAYVGLLNVLAGWASRRLPGFLSTFGYAVAVGAVVAGVADVIENIGMLIMVLRQPSDTLAELVFWMALVKFVLAGLAVLYAGAGVFGRPRS